MWHTGNLAVASSALASSVCSSMVFNNDVMSWYEVRQTTIKRICTGTTDSVLLFVEADEPLARLFVTQVGQLLFALQRTAEHVRVRVGLD